jgi:sarcosine oxidase
VSSATVVGAGVFGASTARSLARRGWDVTLVEQYTPGNVRSGSGGDTRLSRDAHGPVEWYTQLARRARAMWLDLQAESGTRIWEPVGVAWFARRPDGFEAESRRTLERLGIRTEWLEPDEARRLYPSLNTDDLAGVLFEPDAGVLHARRGTQLLVEDAQRHGARLVHTRTTPADEPRTDVVVWACGAWLPAFFPDAVELRISRRDVFFFGTTGDWDGTPGFCEYDGPFYGHGEIGGLGAKIAPDMAGEEVDPDVIDRLPSKPLEQVAREYAALRFPALAQAPVIGRHPERSDWWLLGGGSGHGFKHGPALGEYVADCVEGRGEPEPFHALGPRSGGVPLRSAAVA